MVICFRCKSYFQLIDNISDSLTGQLLYILARLCRSLWKWHCQKILPAGQLVEHLSVTKVPSLWSAWAERRYEAKCQRCWGLGGLPQEIFSFDNTLRAGFEQSAVHIWIYETKSSYLYYTATKDHITFDKDVLKTSCKCKSALIRSPRIEKQKNQLTPVEKKGRWRGREAEREGSGEGGR